MKKHFINLVIIAASSVGISSCGTITGKLSRVTLVDAPRDLEVMADGEKIEIRKELAISNLTPGMSGDTYRDYYAPTIRINKQKTVTLGLSSGNSQGTVDLKPKFSGPYFWSNLFLTGCTGTIVDIATGNHRQHRRFVDVPAVLNGKPISEWRKKSKLKKAIKKSGR